MPNMDEGIVDKDRNVYFLHIAGTGGRALKEYVLNPLFNKKADIVGKHNGWSDFINNKTYIICVLKDPVKHACGFYLHFLNKEQYNDNTKNLFLEYYRSTPKLYNFQSQNLITSGQNFNYNKGEHFEDANTSIDEDLLEQRINRIDLLVSQDQLLENMQDVANNLADDLDLKFIKLLDVSKEKYSNGDSRDLYNSLTDEEKIEIEYLNSIDYKIYSQLRNKELEQLKKRG